MKTGKIIGNVGFSMRAQNKKPEIYLEKYYPIEDRKDFYKWRIVTPKGIHTDFEGDEMYFDKFDLKRAKDVLRAVRKTYRINKEWLK